MPHLKRGVIRDFQNLMGSRFDPALYNRSDFIYHFPKAQLEFFSADEPAKLRGGRRDVLFINECNNIAWDSFNELDIRTRLFTYLDWNPVSEFWAHSNNLVTNPENVYIHSTYQDAHWVLPQAIIDNIEAKRLTDPNWWNVYGLGLLGKVEGLVYPYFEQVDALPEGGQEFYGLDFGYSNDPSVLVKCVIKGTELYCEELIYEAGLTNDAIAHRMDEVGVKRNYDEIFADSAEPKSIDEIARFGFNIKPCPKGADSVEFGHQRIRQYKQFWTKASLNCIKEQRNFRYIPYTTGPNAGKYSDKTTHTYSHGMDARRYGVIGSDNSYEFGFGVT